MGEMLHDRNFYPILLKHDSTAAGGYQQLGVLSAESRFDIYVHSGKSEFCNVNWKGKYEPLGLGVSIFAVGFSVADFGQSWGVVS
jgi:hypothetical protein